MWLGERRGDAVDWITQRWVAWTGRRLDVSDAPWLAGPIGSVHGIGADFFERWGESQGLRVLPAGPADGLLGGLEGLRGPDFDPGDVHPLIDDFYARTSAFEFVLSQRWVGPFRVLGWLISRLFARRLAQLDLGLSAPGRPGGVESRIIRLGDESGEARHTGWVRLAVESGLPVFVGRYGITHLPRDGGACVQVTFPLPNGNAIILLRPRAEPDGGLSLLSDGRRLGEPGFYFTVQAGPGEARVRYVRTMKERLELRVEGGAIAALHRFWVFGLPFLELSYRITPKCPLASGP